MTPPRHSHDECRFGRFCLQPAQSQLLADDAPVKLGARAFDLLLTLVEQRDRVVGKNELLDRVWPDVVVAENNLEVHIWSLRKLLGHRAIVTIPGRGYRFAELLDDATTAVPDPPAPAVPPRPAALRSNLPEHLQALIGRDHDLAALGRLADAQALITLVGAGGIGKTLLALHLLDRQRHARTHGVCWVELGALREASLVVGNVASALGLQLGPGEPLAALVAALAPLKLLLALDNAEHLLPEVARVVEALLAGAAGVQLLVTSQVPLKLTQECQFRLGPLATPEQAVGVQEALRYGAVALFASRARAAQRHFELTPDNVGAVCRVCRQLDGCALAIELAAARLPLLGVQQLADALDERLQLLTKGHRDAPTRQQTLRAALEWSHGLLSADEQAVFRQLAVFAGGCTLELAQAVLAGATLDRWQVIEALDALVDHSLVAVLGCEPPRYRLLESPQALAREQLGASAEEAALRERHALAVQAHFKQVHDAAMSGSCGTDAMEQQLEPDLNNARAALEWALRHSPACAVALARPLSNALTWRRYPECSLLWQATETCLSELSDALPLPVRAEWLLGAAVFSAHRDPAGSQARAQRAADLFRQLGDSQRLALALGVLARGCGADVLDLQRAALDELRGLTRPDWPPALRLRSTIAECLVAYHQGDLPRVEALLRVWLVLADQTGSKLEAYSVRMNLADFALANGNASEAVRLGRELERDQIDSRDIRSLGNLRVNLTAALLAWDDLAAARETARIGWPSAAQLALQPQWADALTLLAALEGRLPTSARLRGHGDAAYAAKAEQRETNELRSVARAEALARAALGDAGFEALRREGAQLSHEQAGALAFACSDGG